MKRTGTIGSLLFLTITTAFASLTSTSTAHAEAWNPENNPGIMVPDYNPRYSQLPAAAELPFAKVPWDETYWPTILGGISYRWNSTNPQPRKYRSPSLAILRTWSENVIAQLSPAEKYDIYVGDYSYPTVRDQFSRKGMFTGDWSGICDGWSAAALNYPEPGMVVLTSKDGIRIPFGSSDIKALLSFNYAVREFRPRKQVGGECRRLAANRYCVDVNPGAFHIVAANKIGLRQEGFVAEIDPSKQVWNQPVYKYSTTEVSTSSPRRGSARGTVSEKLIKMEMTYPQDDETDAGVKTKSHMHPTKGTPDFLISTSTYYYWLELDGADNILGGEWTSAPGGGIVDHPDFIWTPNIVEFRGYYSAIGEIYRASLGAH